MTAEQIRAVEQAAATPAQRLAVALAAVHAARPRAIRELTLDDIDLPSLRITLAGHRQRLGELTRDALLGWLGYRRAAWPDTANRHVLVSRISALGTNRSRRTTSTSISCTASPWNRSGATASCRKPGHWRRPSPPGPGLQHRPHQRHGLRQRRPQPPHQPSGTAIVTPPEVNTGTTVT